VVVAGLNKRVTEGLSYRGGKRVPLFFRFLYKIQFLKFDRKKIKNCSVFLKNAYFLDLSIGFQPVLNLNFKF
jgi:hypothetical protein